MNLYHFYHRYFVKSIQNISFFFRRGKTNVESDLTWYLHAENPNAARESSNMQHERNPHWNMQEIHTATRCYLNMSVPLVNVYKIQNRKLFQLEHVPNNRFLQGNQYSCWGRQPCNKWADHQHSANPAGVICFIFNGRCHYRISLTWNKFHQLADMGSSKSRVFEHFEHN